MMCCGAGSEGGFVVERLVLWDVAAENASTLMSLTSEVADVAEVSDVRVRGPGKSCARTRKGARAARKIE